ncbi:MAG: bifunctional DNA-formamidopyrimidine glycosylase/DNA-(apurinic or apyrimidinic site) lyase [Rhodobacteraceae bacterium]|nr:bifunctional DNA-formamidopyrimidine glycosylase/DNA-(apurinic or apyrimidinic site) lyase [Paracoccaceae bacterium]
MPELPEVETVRRGLIPFMEGKTIISADVRRAGLRWPFPEHLAERLSGKRVEALRRRSKYLLVDLDSGETLLVHLGMSGRIVIVLPGDEAEPGKHDHVEWVMQDSTRIALNDARRFGAMDLHPTAALEAHRFLAALGPEPLGNTFHAGYLHERFAGRKTTIKAALLDQRIVAGLGNIYVSEALHRAAIDPRRAAGKINMTQIEALVSTVRDVLNEAIAAGGATLRDHRQPSGELGYFQHAFKVYDRAGQPCSLLGCGGEIERIVQSGRLTFFCPRCQS